jgi:hypothetical protein
VGCFRFCAHNTCLQVPAATAAFAKLQPQLKNEAEAGRLLRRILDDTEEDALEGVSFKQLHSWV